uniref:ATP synthase subunit a n=1 Tax=Hyaloraphidium curvatum TaxID=82268 RepID=Q950T6_HYACU|nr:ATP synthase F0 subunit 6 [Hyaloraphidium curvatum]AAK83430.1 ATP synthase F0 subunit 6 [Hyaloraphidium curvatum]
MTFYSPMEAYQVIPVFGPVNDVAIFLVIGFSFLLILGLGLSKMQTVVPSNWYLAIEAAHTTIFTMVRTYIGPAYAYWLPFLFTLFFGLFFSNVFGLLPYSTTPTTHLIITFNLAVFLLVTAIANGFRRYGYAMMGLFIPSGTPLPLIPMLVVVEMLAYVTRIIALGIRISVNMITGHTLVKVIGGFLWEAFEGGTNIMILILPMVLLTVFLVLEVLIAYLQAYIYTFICMITIKDFL